MKNEKHQSIQAENATNMNDQSHQYEIVENSNLLIPSYESLSEFYLLPPYENASPQYESFSDNNLCTKNYSKSNNSEGIIAILSTVGHFEHTNFNSQLGDEEVGYFIFGNASISDSYKMLPIQKKLGLQIFITPELPAENSEVVQILNDPSIEGIQGVEGKISLSIESFNNSIQNAHDFAEKIFLIKSKTISNYYPRPELSTFLEIPINTDEFKIHINVTTKVSVPRQFNADNPSHGRHYSMIDLRINNNDTSKPVMYNYFDLPENKPATGGIKIPKIKCELFSILPSVFPTPDPMTF